MIRKPDPSQGTVPYRQPKARPVARPAGQKILRGIQHAVSAEDAANTRPRPPQKITGKQDWRRG
jgi:hypothetical protein